MEGGGQLPMCRRNWKETERERERNKRRSLASSTLRNRIAGRNTRPPKFNQRASASPSTLASSHQVARHVELEIKGVSDLFQWNYFRYSQFSPDSMIKSFFESAALSANPSIQSVIPVRSQRKPIPAVSQSPHSSTMSATMSPAVMRSSRLCGPSRR